MKLLANGGLEFTRQELKELFEPIIKNFGFEYEAFLDSDKRGLVWTKQFDWAGDVTDPLMVIEESAADFVGVDYAADYFHLDYIGKTCVYLRIQKSSVKRTMMMKLCPL